MTQPRTMSKCYIGKSLDASQAYLGEGSVREILVWGQLLSNEQVRRGGHARTAGMRTCTAASIRPSMQACVHACTHRPTRGAASGS